MLNRDRNLLKEHHTWSLNKFIGIKKAIKDDQNAKKKRVLLPSNWKENMLYIYIYIYKEGIQKKG